LILQHLHGRIQDGHFTKTIEQLRNSIASSKVHQTDLSESDSIQIGTYLFLQQSLKSGSFWNLTKLWLKLTLLKIHIP